MASASRRGNAALNGVVLRHTLLYRSMLRLLHLPSRVGTISAGALGGVWIRHLLRHPVRGYLDRGTKPADNSRPSSTAFLEAPGNRMAAVAASALLASGQVRSLTRASKFAGKLTLQVERR